MSANGHTNGHATKLRPKRAHIKARRWYLCFSCRSPVYAFGSFEADDLKQAISAAKNIMPRSFWEGSILHVLPENQVPVDERRVTRWKP